MDLEENSEGNEDVTATEDSQQLLPSQNGSPLPPPLNKLEEEAPDEDSDPLDFHDKEDVGPPAGAPPRRREKKRACSPRMPVMRTVGPPPDGFTLSDKKFFAYRTQLSRPADWNWSELSRIKP